MLTAIIFIPITIFLIYCLYYNKYNIRFFLPIILITIISFYIILKIIKSLASGNADGWASAKLIIAIIVFLVLWSNEHNIIVKDFGIEKNMNYINNVLFINNRKL